MSEASSVTSSVEVAVDSVTAFKAFTEEIDCWWLQGPINFHDSSRTYAKRIEPGVGGRVLEVYDEASGDGLELARITVWEPPKRLAWKSSIDDVDIEVRFEESGSATVVTVEATLPQGGKDAGGTAWVRMTPPWFARWVAKREQVPHEPRRLARLAVAIHYDHPAAAGRWLRDVFGLVACDDIPEQEANDDHVWIEFQIGECLLIVLQREGEGERASASHTPWVFVDDLDAHFAHAKAGGAKIRKDIWQHGPRAYDVEDLEGNPWTFAQASPLMR